ncbi:hypothetical protein CQA58_01065 [Helicobacter brantae]|uniref:Autotransporter domain-containing protein n=2 Tax=Helicobacter brantae TaxID=375927 RepID=A0A3D8J4U9_9HELI|nr:hypothetical protein CQA58_01065 [Helicobacter brantae]
MPPPPREMKKILISSALAVLLGVSAEASNGSGVSVDSSNNVIFSDTNSNTSTQSTNNTFAPSGGVYEANSTNNTITFNLGVQTAHIDGGIKAGSGTKITLDFQGAGVGQGQILNFGSATNTDSQVIQTQSGGGVVFNFSDNGATKDNKNNYVLYGMTADTKMLNDGNMEFNLNKHTLLMIGNSANFVIENKNGNLTFNFSDNSALQSNPDLYITNSGSGKTIFNFNNFSDTSNKAELDVESVELKNNSTGSVEFVFQDSSARLVSLFENNKLLVTKTDFVFNFKGNSFVVLQNENMTEGSLDTPSNLKDVTFTFSSSDNKLSLVADVSARGVGIFEMKWLDVKADRNYISLAPLLTISDKIIYTDMLLPRENNFTFLEIGEKGVADTGISGNGMNFIVYANISKKEIVYDASKIKWSYGQDIQADKNGIYTYADRLFIHSSQDSNTPTTHNLGIIISLPMRGYLDRISYTPSGNGEKGDVTTKGNIAVATVANDSNVTLNALSGSLLGFNLIETSFEKIKTNEQGIIQANSQDNTYTTYFLSSARDMGVASATQEVTSSVFALNYDLFLANFNSLNKRMGDLRDNPYSQGAWGRIFNGQLSNDFGLGSQNNYTTLQAGYDYDFGLENARDYLGVAFSYGFSISEMSSSAKDALQSREITDIFSNSIELALYNAYVSDNGLYSDSIAKFSYLMSDFNLTNNSTTESLGVNNYALSLSEEVGYVFTLGESKEWSITPQAELGLGYYSSSDLTQVAGDFYLDAKADSLLMLRARIGSMVGYDFKQFTQGKDIQASLYAGLSYEYDYLSGGDIELTPNVGEKTLKKSALSSDSRGVLNVGTNLAIKDNTRVYVDFQTSFGGKINTDYQINIGARFSFGESATPKPLNTELPLKPTEG